MNNLCTIFVVFSCCFIVTALAAVPPQKCNQVISYYEVMATDINATITSTFTLSKNDQNNQSQVSITDVNISSTQKFEIQKICALRDLFLGYPICGSSSYPLTFPIENSTFFLQIYVMLESGDSTDISVTYGLIDEGSLSFFEGQIFSDDKKCFSLFANNTYGFENVTQCCTSLEPIEIQDVSINTPQCTKFKSRTTVYNIDNNYSIYFTSKINYTRLGQNLIAHGDLTGPMNFQVMYGENGYDVEEVPQNTLINLTFSIANGDCKVLLQMEALNSTERYSPMLLVGRIIYRNNQTLMEEGIPFTKQNDCQYFNRMYSENQVATTSFCCTKFESDAFMEDANRGKKKLSIN